MTHSAIDEFVNIVDRLPAGRRGEAADWVQHLSEQVPPDLYMEYERFLRTLTSSEQRKASEDVETFAIYLGKALSKLRSRKLVRLEGSEGSDRTPNMLPLVVILECGISASVGE